MSTPAGEPTEEEIRALEEQLSRLRVIDVIVENAVTIVNLAFRRAGLAPGTEAERDPDQVRLGIDAVTTLLPLIERAAPPQAVTALRDAVSQLQMAFVRMQGGEGPAAGTDPPAPPPGGAPQGPPPPQPGSQPGEESGPAQRSGRLWVPGQ